MKHDRALTQLFTTLQKANVHEYECHGCGHWKPSDQLEDRTIYDQGDITEVLVCTHCLSLGWDNWGQS